MDRLREDIIKKLHDIRLRLLDLSKRNRLLNFRQSKLCIRIVDEQPSQVFEYLVKQGKPMTFLPTVVPEDQSEVDRAGQGHEPSLSEQAETLLGVDLSDDLPAPEYDDGQVPKKHRDNKLQTRLFMPELETRLRRMRTKARSIIEETGKNQLFIGLGFLKWKESSDSTEFYEAPLIMIPVALERGRLDAKARCYTYSVQYTGEDLIPNLSLREKLKGNDLILPDFEDEHVLAGGDGEKELDPEAYFDAVTETIAKMEGWEVRRRMVLGFLTFSKLLMYLDLDPSAWPDSSIADHHLIRTLFGTEDSLPEIDLQDMPREMTEVESLPLVVDADSSQTEAILRAIKGQSMVIQGPPGTGKSQTITNLIACFLDAGKSVLFLAEKMAALDVVFRNLEKVGLSDFCLELHSRKANKSQVLESLKKRTHLKPGIVRLEAELERLRNVRESLTDYVGLVKKPVGPDGETVFEIFGKVELLSQRFSQPVSLSIDNVDGIKSNEIEYAIETLAQLSRWIGELGLPRKSAWYGYQPTELYHGDHEVAGQHLESAKAAITRIISNLAKVFSQTGLALSPCDLTVAHLEALHDLDLQEMPISLPQDLVATMLLARDDGALEELRSLQRSVHEYQKKTEVADRFFEGLGQVSNGELEQLSQMATRISERGLATLDLGKTRELVQVCQTLNDLLSEFGTLIRGHLAAGFSEPEAIADLKRVVRIDSLLRERPQGIKASMIDGLFAGSMRVLFTEIVEKGERLARERKSLGSVFALEDVCSATELAAIRRTLRQKQGRLLGSLSGGYRKAQHILRGFLRDRSRVKSRALLVQLERLEDFIAEESQFTHKEQYRETFGDLFRGLETDWNELNRLVAWVTSLCDATANTDRARVLAGMPKNLQEDWCPSAELRHLLNSLDVTIGTYISIWAEAGHTLNLSEVIRRPIASMLRELNELQTLLASFSNSIARLTPEGHSTISDFKAAIHYEIGANKLQSQIEANKGAKSLLGRYFKGVHTDIDSIVEGIDWALRIRELDLPENLVETIAKANTGERITSIAQCAKDCEEDLGSIKSDVSALYQFGDMNIDDFFGDTVDRCPLAQLASKLDLALSQLDSLTRWADYCRLGKRGREMGLAPIISLVESGELPLDQATDGYLYVVYNSVARRLLREHPRLSTFTRTEFESKRQRFAELDRTILELYQRRIAYNASQTKVPPGRRGLRVRDYTDMCLLNKEFNKTRRHLPIRRLMERSGDAIRALKPVFMMSPMSVAQFLEPGKHTFDVVIMDEASQIQPHDALGAIARAKQMIVVGDSKQLPPTTFFEAEMSNPENEQGEETIFDETDASSSILDICEAARLVPCRLRWHYRSEHESLIAFSNVQWYDNDLVVFPSSGVSPTELGVSLEYVENATYAAGKNVVEADYVAQRIVEHARRSPELSLGVGTFNLIQRDLIEDRLAKLRKEDASVESAIAQLMKAHEGNEPLFIKNLENLQGDERDVIFISCTFGPDPVTGKVRQNFGPINSPNGRRRLNVLFTRAKKRMKVLSSMKPEDITVEPGREGRVALKGFLKYAETGKLPDYGQVTDRGPDSDFEIAVAKVLKSLGYEVKPQVGVAGYFVDIGVHHPNRPGEFILGIECDGATYHSSMFARDRDRLREEVLRRRGWRIHRIWSTDWFKNRKSEIERLREKLQTLVEEDRREIAEVEQIAEAGPSVLRRREPRLTDAELRSRIKLFCLENIARPEEAQRDDGFLNDEILEALVTRHTTSLSEFREYVPAELRGNLNSDDLQYIHDIFDIIEQASSESRSSSSRL